MSTSNSAQRRQDRATEPTLSRASSICSWLVFTLSAISFLCLLPRGAAQSSGGIIVSELPAGGNVTVPGQYPIQIPPATEVLLSGMDAPQSITLSNKGKSQSVVHIYAQHEKSKRTLHIKPGMSAVYNLKWGRPIRVRVESGKVDALSLAPIKIQR